MKLIKPSYTIIPQGTGLEGIYRQIELAGRILIIAMSIPIISTLLETIIKIL